MTKFDQTTDEELVTLYQNGDANSFQELMRRYLKPVFNFTRQYVHTSDVAEDITQDTFFKAWKHLKKFKSGKKWKPWIFTIARNTTLDHLKKKKAVAFSALDSLDNEQNDGRFSETLEDTEPLAAEIFEQIQNVQELTTAMNTLRPEYNAVLLLHYHQELTFEEIATVMGIPMNTVKSWHRRALEKIREILIANPGSKIAPK